MYDVSREKKVYTIYPYIVIRQIIYNEVFFFLNFSEQEKKESRQNVNILTDELKCLRLIKFQHSQLCFVGFMFNFLFSFYFKKYTSKYAWKCFPSI